jgi:Spy/CpxP family protein refolding chaperone
LFGNDVCFSGSVSLTQEGPPGGPPQLMFLDKLLQLNLTDTQETKLRVIFETYRPEHEKLMNDLREARENLRNLMESDTFNEKKIREAYQKVSTVKEDLLVLRGKLISDVGSVLNSDQIEQTEQWKQERMEHIRAFRGF